MLLLLFLFNCFAMAIGAYKRDQKVREAAESEREREREKTFHLMRDD